MRPHPHVLSPAEIGQFHRDGFVVVRHAFSRVDAAAMEQSWWVELETVHGIRREDRSTWQQPVGDLKRAKRDALQGKILTRRVRGVIDDLLGEGTWPVPRDFGRTLVTFREPGIWDVPKIL